MTACRYSAGGSRAFTLLELMTVLVIVAILSVMLLPVFQKLQMRAARAKCVENLRSLHVAADLYIQEHHSWPQIKNDGVTRTTLATKWMADFQPYSLAQINWICPTMQQLLGNPDLTNPNNVRIDYTATPFDAKPTTPYQWVKQPWFVENGNMHGNGNLIVFSDGHVVEMNDLLSAQSSAAPSGRP